MKIVWLNLLDKLLDKIFFILNSVSFSLEKKYTRFVFKPISLQTPKVNKLSLPKVKFIRTSLLNSLSKLGSLAFTSLK